MNQERDLIEVVRIGSNGKVTVFHWQLLIRHGIRHPMNILRLLCCAIQRKAR